MLAAISVNIVSSPVLDPRQSIRNSSKAKIINQIVKVDSTGVIWIPIRIIVVLHELNIIHVIIEERIQRIHFVSGSTKIVLPRIRSSARVIVAASRARRIVIHCIGTETIISIVAAIAFSIISI